ncbi:MAG TPA: response regulator [Thermoanaerobaculia bacterium]|jgi:DNA-binding response OmpR family regulator|nr:response regulator [Thermoanaerobaculia bacterium]
MSARVLIADDQPEIRELIARILVCERYEIDSVGNGRTAIERLQTESYDAVLLDFMMPLPTGFEVVDWVEQNRPNMAKSCVIIITAAVRDLQKFDASRVYAVLEKPFDLVQLVDTVKACIESKKHD